jgi:predicted DNA-binding transcriptional regulator YafY
MTRISEQTRQQRKDRILALLRQYPDGLSEREIAERLNFERRTTNNYLRELEIEARIEKDGQAWCISPFQKPVLRSFDLTPEEAMVLYLASRLYVKQSDQRNETAETVLLRLATVLSSDMGLEDDIVRAAQELAQHPVRPGYEDVFRTMMRAYIYRCRVDLTYHPYRGQPFTTTFAPYLLEPSAIGFSTYAIGYSSVVDDLRTYKVERIEHAALRLRDTYTVPASFPGLELLQNAWSIYYGEDLVTVTLRFAPDVVKRVQETQWHPSQVLAWDEEQPDHLLVTFEVADTTDLLPWIRTWGANCKVLAPDDLRDQMMGEARRLAHLYGWNTSTSLANKHARFNDIFGSQ